MYTYNIYIYIRKTAVMSLLTYTLQYIFVSIYLLKSQERFVLLLLPPKAGPDGFDIRVFVVLLLWFPVLFVPRVLRFCGVEI